MDDFMIDVIPHDFEVELLRKEEDVCLFYRFKRGIVHFVKDFDNSIVQQHISRVTLARYLERFFHSDMGTPDKPMAVPLNENVLIRKFTEDTIQLQFGQHTFEFTFDSDKEFFAILKQEAENYRKAVSEVKFQNESCFLEKIKTVDGNRMESIECNSDMLTAIAFEYLISEPKTSKTSISFWELYSWYKEGDIEISSNWTDHMAQFYACKDEDLLSIYSALLRSKYLDSFGEDEAVEPDNCSDLIALALKRLSSVQKIQFKTLYSLFHHPFVLPLAWVTGVMDTYDYKDITGGGFQPDSENVQFLSYVLAVLEDFGKCMQQGLSKDESPGVTIGMQTWMADNLDVKTFRNGDPILQVTSEEDWAKAKEEEQAAWCYYMFDEENGEKYGKLYNFNAVHDPRELAPEGWRIPSSIDWSILTDYLGDEAGTYLKKKDAWDEMLDKDKDCYFNALPGGLHNFNFNKAEDAGYYWTSDKFMAGETQNGVHSIIVKGKSEIMTRGYFDWCYMSIRCIR
jgi:uncharacterized protein (TIGR02145 family)